MFTVNPKGWMLLTYELGGDLSCLSAGRTGHEAACAAV